MPSAAVNPYQLKHSPYSSHSLLLASLPSKGTGRRVLDVGCAGGYLGAILAERGFQVTGIDSPGTARAGFPESIELVEADLDMGLPPLAGKFDFVICADILEHLRRPAALLSELNPVLAQGGRLAASLPNSGHAYFRWNVLRGRFPAEDRGLFDRTHLHFYTWRGWLDLFAAGGFHIETLRCSGVPIGLALPKWEGTAAVRALERMSYESARGWKRMFAYQFIVTAVSEREP
ncbi:MAG TPA: methyltransferase domain-containing protein [Bryobacteraceae bacterium]|nr:methyltransferase domain-containing protein [Bryobacteraceae bacterium]